jgi:integrase
MKTFAEMLALYKSTIDSNRSLKASTRKYYSECITYGMRCWPGLETRDVATISKFDCLAWNMRLKYAPTRMNGIHQQFRAIFGLAVEMELIKENPMCKIKPTRVRVSPPKIPTAEQICKLLECISWNPHAKRGLRMIKFMLYSGRRIGECRKLTREDITEHGMRVVDTKNGETVVFPILPELRELLKELPASGPLFKIKNPRRLLQEACTRLGLPRLTNHHLRHLFATRAIECGVDIPTVARMLGHKDGGALCLKRYNHVGDEHMRAKAETVRFNPVPTR